MSRFIKEFATESNVTESAKTQLKAGQSVLCRVERPETGGYSATLLPFEIEAFLPSQEPLEPGQTVPATFVCMSNNRALMTFAFMLGTTERVQFGLPSEEETAFAVWADSHPRSFELRRATDMIMPNPHATNVRSIRSGDLDVEKLLADLEASRLTGCIKAESATILSRSGAILYRGRAVGCVYGRKDHGTRSGVEVSLRAMLEDLKREDTELLIYDLPQEAVLCMSSLFFGVPVESRRAREGANSQERVQALIDEFQEKKETACLVVGDAARTFECLGFLYQGDSFGSFSIGDQRFSAENDLLLKSAETIDSSTLDAYLLPKEMTSNSVLFGYSLTALLERQD